MPKLLQHLHQPLTVPRGFQSDQRRRRQLPIPSFRFAVAIHQLLLCHLGSLVVEPGNLLPAGMVITPYNKHRRLLSSPASFLVLNRKRRLRIEREPSLLSNQPNLLLVGWDSLVSPTLNCPSVVKFDVEHRLRCLVPTLSPKASERIDWIRVKAHVLS